MRLLSLLLLSLTLGVSALAKVEVNKNGTQTVYRFSIEGVDFESKSFGKELFVQPNLKGIEGWNETTSDVGYPELPVIRFYVENLQDIKVVSGFRTLNQQKSLLTVFPKQPAMIKTQEKASGAVFNKSAYTLSKFWPRKIYDVKDAGSIAGVKQQLVTLYPFAYNPATKQYQVTENFEVYVETKEAVEAQVQKEVFVFVVGAKFLNSPSLAQYKALKERQGFNIETIAVDGANKDPDKIREALKALFSRYGRAMKYALIIGDNEDVPAKTAGNLTSGVTDHYYRSIDTDDYDSDINGPDIGVGRISAADEAQLAKIFEKYTRYIMGQFSNEAWLNTVSFLATNDRYLVAEGSHNYAIENYTAPRGYVGEFPNANQAGGDRLYAITHKVTKEKTNEVIRKGKTIINYSGHGAKTFWDAPNVTQDNVRAMQDPNALPFVISNACVTADFRVAESFAETWQRHPYGAIVFWGSMDSSYWDEDDILERRMYDHIYRDNSAGFSDITNYALSELWKHYAGGTKSKYYWETYTVFGDPSIDLRTTATFAPVVDGPEVLTLGISDASYRVLNGSQPVAGVRVGFNIPSRGIHLAQVTDMNGVVNFDLKDVASEPFDAELVITGRNTRAVSKLIRMIPADGPYLYMKNFTVNNRAEGLFVGENIEMKFSINNLGLAGTTGGEVVVESIEGPAQLLVNRIQVPAIQRGETVAMSQGIRFVIDPAAQMDQVVKINLAWSTAEGKVGLRSAIFVVKKAALEVTQVTVDGGGIRPGQSGTIKVTVKNVGTEALSNAQLVTQAGECISAMNNTIPVALVAPGQAVVIENIGVAISAECRNGQIAKFAIAGDYQSVASRPQVLTSSQFAAGVVVLKEINFNGPSVNIPDGSSIMIPISMPAQGVITEVALHVEITHTYIGDLVISLIHPDGTEVLLRTRSGGAERNLNETYGMDGVIVAELANFIGKSSQGEWKIKIADTAPRDIGSLDKATLKIKGYVD